MYARILVGIDGSYPSVLALDEAIRLAKEQGSKLRIVHVVDEGLVVSPNVPSANLGETEPARLEEGRSILESARDRARKEGVEPETVLLEEMTHQPGSLLIDQAVEWPADLIVCGTHGRSGVQRLLLGSDSEYVARHSAVPVLLVRGK
ncbi:MAG: universal stress protein [Proteobacteria bacterium]|nr:universal stress protein [Pseudomonadota bacterium]